MIHQYDATIYDIKLYCKIVKAEQRIFTDLFCTIEFDAEKAFN